jgi:large subunit ribosomal protein L18
MKNTKLQLKKRRQGRIRAKISGTAETPRVAVFRSNKNIFVQFIDDVSGKTIFSNTIGTKTKVKGAKTETAGKIGETLAQKAIEAGISKIVFDRGGYKYHGRIKALAEGLRKGGLKF